MNRDKIIDSYKSAVVAHVDLESKVMNKLKENGQRKIKLNMRTIVLVCLILVLTTTMVIAISRIIDNADGSHTLLDENNNETWTITANDNMAGYEVEERKALKRANKEALSTVYRGDESQVVYLKYDMDREPIYYLMPIHESFTYNDDIMTALDDHIHTPVYMFDMIGTIEEYFKINYLRYYYVASDAQQEELIKEAEEKNVFNEVYTNMFTMDKDLFYVSFALESKHLDKLRNVNILIAEKPIWSSKDSYEVGFETLVVKGKPTMLSEQNNGSYVLVGEVNGVSYSITADPLGDINNMVEIAEKLISVLENYE